MTSSPMFRSAQPCSESKLPKSKDNPNLESIRRTKNHLPTKPNRCGWSTITTNLCNTTTSKSNDKPRSEFQPINLTQTNLDMCTEVLGSETGKECFDLVDFFPVTCEDSGETMKKKKTNERMWSTRPAVVPPCPMLKSVVAGNTVRIRRCRENGKCVLKATMEPSSCFLVVTQRSVGSDGECPTLSIRYFDRNQTAFATKDSGGLSSRLVTRYHPVKRVDEEEGVEEVEEVSEEEEVEEIGSVQMGEYKRGSYECNEEEMAVAVAVASGQNRRYTSDVSTIRCC